MKKCIFLFFVLCMVAGFTAADDKGICLSVGLEFGVENINKADDSEMDYYLMPMLIYENSFLDDALDIYAELDYKIDFTKVPDEDGNEVNPQSLYFDLMLGYNLSLGSASTLSFILENEFDKLLIFPQYKKRNALTGIFTPAVKFNQQFDFGDLFARVGVPITYIQYDKDANSTTGLDFTLGWDSTFGFGIEAKLRTLIVPEDAAGYQGVEAIVSYEKGSVYVEVETIIPWNIGDEGVTITPLFNFSFWDIKFYLKCEFSRIGVIEGDMIISPALGIKISF